MKEVNLITHQNVKLTLFPDNQPHVDLENIYHGDDVNVVATIKSSLDLMHVIQVADTLDSLGAHKTFLTITYLLGARSDRIMKFGGSFDLRVVARLINLCEFQKVFIYDPHSEAALNLIHNSTAIPPFELILAYDKPDAVLICPDYGARIRVHLQQSLNSNLNEVVYCNKHRDSAGRVDLSIFETEKCTGRNCVIIDDICDGGATFLAIAKLIQPSHLTLMVSHGIFSKGTRALKEEFNEIITTDSYRSINEQAGIRIIKLWT